MIKNAYLNLVSFATGFQSLLLLILRLYIGYSFFTSGMGKWQDIGTVEDYFASLSIPFPLFNAYVVAFIELIGGACIFLGFATRLAAIPMIVVMLVALLTASHNAVIHAWNDPNDFIEQLPFIYLLVLLVIFACGPGKISVDHLLERFLK